MHFVSIIDYGSGNLKSVFNTTKSALRGLLKARKGSIINLSSVVGVNGNAGQANCAPPDKDCGQNNPNPSDWSQCELNDPDYPELLCEENVGENRYNLYHHLEVLIQSKLIIEDGLLGKTRRFKLNIPNKPEVGVLLFNQDDILNNLSSWKKILSLLEQIEGEKIPIKNKIKEIEVHIKY